MRHLFFTLLPAFVAISTIIVNIYLIKRFYAYFIKGLSKPLYAMIAIIVLFVIVSFILLSHEIGSFSDSHFMAASILMGVLAFLILSVILVDISLLFIHIKPKFAGLIVLSLALSIIGYSVWNASTTRIKYLDIQIPRLAKEYRIMHLSDMHIGPFRGQKFVQNIVDKTIDCNVDAVIITGDLYDGVDKLDKNNIQPFTKIKTPIFFIEGNHDISIGSEKVKQAATEVGMIVLENEIVNFNEIQIIGLDYLPEDESSYYKEKYSTKKGTERKTIKSVLLNLEIDKEKPSILLHHSPAGIKYINQKGVDLFLSGHTHAGQLFPFTWIIKHLFKYHYGLHNYNGTNIFVSQGIGTSGPPMRLGSESEMVVLKLTPRN